MYALFGIHRPGDVPRLFQRRGGFGEVFRPVGGIRVEGIAVAVQVLVRAVGAVLVHQRLEADAGVKLLHDLVDLRPDQRLRGCLQRVHIGLLRADHLF